MAFGMQPVWAPECPAAGNGGTAAAQGVGGVAQGVATGLRQGVAGPGRTGLPLAPTGEALVAPLYLLDELAWSLGVTHLSSFTDDRLLPGDADPDPGKALAALGPREDWHAVRDGLHSCAALLRELQRNPQAEVNDAAMQALQALHDCLAHASQTVPARQWFRLDAPSGGAQVA